MTQTQCFKRKLSPSTESRQKNDPSSLSPSGSLTPAIDFLLHIIYSECSVVPGSANNLHLNYDHKTRGEQSEKRLVCNARAPLVMSSS